MPLHFFRRGDILILFIITFFTFSVFKLNQSFAPSAVKITAAGKLWGKFPLNPNKRLTVDGPLGSTEIVITNSTLRFLSSPCRLKLCIRQGAVRQTGSYILCAPNQVAASITGKADTAAPDGVSR